MKPLAILTFNADQVIWLMQQLYKQCKRSVDNELWLLRRRPIVLSTPDLKSDIQPIKIWDSTGETIVREETIRVEVLRLMDPAFRFLRKRGDSAKFLGIQFLTPNIFRLKVEAGDEHIGSIGE